MRGAVNSRHLLPGRIGPMISHACRLVRKSLALPAVVIVCLLPTAAWAEVTKITNTTNIVVVVESSSVNNGRFHRGKNDQLKPGAHTAMILPGEKTIVIRDASAPPQARPLGVF